MTGRSVAQELPAVHYSAENSPQSTLHHALRAFALPRLLARHRGLLRHFVTRELRGRFHGSVLGPLWVLIHPLFLFAVYFVVFGVVMGRWDEGQDTLQFAVYLFSGVVCFHAIVQSTHSAMNAIAGNSNIVKKVKFPCEVLPLVPVFVETVVFLVGFAVALAVGLISGRAQLGWSLLALPWFVVVFVMFASGIGLLLANLDVFVRDVRHIYGIFTTVWFFLSPCFWWPNFVAEKAPWAATLMTMNPAYHLLIAERHVLGLAPPELGFTTTVVGDLGVASAWALGFLLVGYGSFMANKHKYADLV
ncbi:MAG: ABC transporter permease [Planctomycetes bacterium]|nr:ABC transporter permease [Planctomycetota bacterium]